MSLPSRSDLAQTIDHSLLRPTLSARELDVGCRLALEYGVASVCILPYYVARCAELLSRSAVLPSTTIGFPHGAHKTSVKLFEAERALDDGARELDLLVNVSQVLSGDFASVREEIAEIVALTQGRGQRLKVIFENCYLDEAHKLRLCEICGELGVDFVKTSTGYGSSGATVADVTLMRRNSPASVAVKASGGIQTLDALLALREAGATRFGTSKTREILDELSLRLSTEKR